MLSVMSEPSLGVSGVIPGLDGNFSESSALRDDGRSKNQDSSSTVRFTPVSSVVITNTSLLHGD